MSPPCPLGPTPSLGPDAPSPADRPTRLLTPAPDGGCGWSTARRRVRRATRAAALDGAPRHPARRYRRAEIDLAS